MPIRPIDMQVAIPKMSEVSRMSHLEQQKAGLQQDQQAVTGEKGQERQSQAVLQSKESARSDTDADPRKKGRGTYGDGRRQKKKDEAEPIKQPKSKNKIDIRI